MSGSTTVVTSKLPCVSSLATHQLEDLATEHCSLTQRRERIADAFQRIAAGDGADHRPRCCPPQRILEVGPGCGHRRYPRRLGEDELYGMNRQRLAGVAGRHEAPALGEAAHARGHRCGGAHQLEEDISAAA